MQINEFKLRAGASRVRHPSYIPSSNPTFPHFLFRSLPCCVDNHRRRIVFETESETEREMTNILQEFSVQWSDCYFLFCCDSARAAGSVWARQSVFGANN